MLLLSPNIVVSVELSVACNIQIGENEKGRCVSDFSTIHALLFFNFPANGLSNSASFLA